MEVLRFALLGLGLGALYSLASQGLLVVYRGSGVLNFAHGAIGMVGAYAAWETRVTHGQSVVVSWAVGIAVGAVIGALTHLLIMRQLRRASPLARIVATLGVLIVLQAAAVLRYGSRITFVESELPTTAVEPLGVSISVDRFILLGIAAVFSVGLWALYRFSTFGMATSAVAENERSASSLGLSPDRIATANWAIGSALAALAAILIAPIVQLQVVTMTNLVLAAMAAALVAGFRSFPVAFAAGVAIGIGQTVLTRFVTTPGVSSSLPFAVIIGWMLLRGQALPLRDYFLQRLPAVGSGRIRPVAIVVAAVATVVVVQLVPPRWQDAFVTTFALGLVLLSVVVITGYAGQLSLGQFALAGFGALIAGRLVDAAGWPFLPALLAGAIATVPVGALFALPAVRARGINLAIVTLGLGSAIELMVFNNGRFVGGFAGTTIGKPSLFGIDVNAIAHPGRYAIVCMVVFIAVALMVANLRRGRAGRRLLAVRTNERAAAALGISVPGAKVYAFALSAGIAALGGTLLAFRKDVIIYGTEFSNFTSITAVGWAFVGGIGFLVGPLFGSTLAPGSLGAQLSNAIFSGLDEYIQLIGGGILILLVLQNQDGIAREATVQLRGLATRLPRGVARALTRPPTPIVLADEERRPVPPMRLDVSGLTVRYGGVTAVDDLSLRVEPGKVLGLIGPNGAGKTSAIDAITGFTRADAGSVRLDGRELVGLSTTARARAGLSRSFQSLELFEDATVHDNLRAASDPRDRWSYLRDLFWPVDDPLSGEVVAAVREFQLTDDLHRHVQDLPYGQRRLLALARAVATRPSVLLLDEPAAGLGDNESAELAHLVRRLADDWGIAVLLVEHDMNFVMGVCDEIVVLDFGRCISEGTADEVRRDPAVIAAYLGDDAGADEPAVDLRTDTVTAPSASRSTSTSTNRLGSTDETVTADRDDAATAPTTGTNR
ncbi:MAG: branched-chain amino acid ABC transporter permease/ATP-binding protein [Actinomycetota bacterium]|nr:branched-chain amino acid ABC transporter permease/ATP-binding protein [Actinomycetota bacterium]